MGTHRAGIAAAQEAATEKSRSETNRTTPGACGNNIRPADRHAVADASPGNGLRFRHELLAVFGCLAKGWRVAENPRDSSREAARGRQDRLESSPCGQFIGACSFGGLKTGPNPTDRAKKGSKHHVVTEAEGTPLIARVTGANVHDGTQLIDLVDAIPPVRGKCGRPRQRPEIVQGDKAYHSRANRAELRSRGIKPELPKRGVEAPAGVGRTRWYVERTIAWIHQHRRLRVRYERRPDIHQAFLTLARVLTCWSRLNAA